MQQQLLRHELIQLCLKLRSLELPDLMPSNLL
jgi:hypothetical protein